MRGTDMSSGAKGSGGPKSLTDGPPPVAAGTGSHTTAKDDDSGLIDIKNMARSTRRRVTERHSTESEVEDALLASSSPSALRDVVLPEPGKEQPVRLATEDDAVAMPASASAETERKSSGPWLALVAAVVLIGGSAAAYFATRGGDGDKAEQTVAANSARQGSGAAGGGAPAAPAADDPSGEPGAVIAAMDDQDDTDTDSTGDTAVETDPDEAPAKADSDDDGKTDGKRDETPRAKADSDSGNKRSNKGDAKSPRKDPPKKDEPKKDVENKPAGNDLDSLLDHAAGSDGSQQDDADDKPAVTEKKPAKSKLSRGDVQTGMRSVKARVAACYEQFKVPGTVQVKVTISNTGVVTKATASGKFANTDTGACVARAVTAATFPEFSGPSMSLTYPFLLQ